MDYVRIAVLEAYDNICTFLDNSIDGAMHYYGDELHNYLSGSAYTFSFKTSSNHDDSQFLVVGNKLSFVYKNKGYYCNIVSADRNEKYIKITAYGLSLELSNEETGPYKASGALSFSEYIKAFNFEDQVFLIGLNEVSDKKITHEWEGTETILARLFSLANVFDAEIEFVTELNSDYSLGNIVLNVYKKHDINVQGMGIDRRSETIRYGINIRGISKSSDITELYTAIRPTGTDGMTLAKIDKKEYDSLGNLEYYSPIGANEILAPQARDRFPSTLATSKNDRYMTKVWSYETSNVNTLYGQALAQLKKNCTPQVSYKIDGFIDASIGDTFTIEDKEYKPTLYLEARITEQIISFTDKKMCETVFDNFIERQSQVDDSLIKQMNDLINANKLYKGNIISSNGIIFKDKNDKTTLKALVNDGTNDITALFKINWYENNEIKATSKTEIDVLATDLENDRSVFRFEALTDNGVVKASAEVTVMKVNDGTVYSTTPPEDTTKIWFDTTDNLLKFYDSQTSTWKPVVDLDTIQEQITTTTNSFNEAITKANEEVQKINKEVETSSENIQGIRSDLLNVVRITEGLNAELIKKLVTTDKLTGLVNETTLKAYLDWDIDDDGHSFLKLGGSKFKTSTRIRDDGFYIDVDGNTSAYFTSNGMYSNEVETKELKIGDFTLRVDSSGSLIIS